MRQDNNDIELLNRIKNDDEIAFKELFDTYFTSLCRFLYIYTNDKALIEELVLDVFANFWENRKNISIQLSLKAYLYQSTKNIFLNSQRRKNLHISIDEVETDLFHSTTTSTLESDELSLLIFEAVSKLPEKCKLIFELSRNDNMTNQEIANQLNLNIKTVEAHITRALKRIREKLGENYFYLF